MKINTNIPLTCEDCGADYEILAEVETDDPDDAEQWTWLNWLQNPKCPNCTSDAYVWDEQFDQPRSIPKPEDE